MSENTGYPSPNVGTAIPSPRKHELVLSLAADVLGTDDEPSELLYTALDQLINKVNLAGEPAQPVDWAAIVQENVQGRPNFF